MNPMQKLMAKVQQMGNSINAAAGSSANAVATWGEVLGEVDAIIREKDQQIAAGMTEIAALRTEVAKLKESLAIRPSA